MPGEEVLLGIGLLCNAMQIITFGRDALQVFKRVRDGHSPDPNLDTYIKGATTSYETMQARIQGVHPTCLTKDERELLAIGEKYKERLEKLANKLDELTVPKDAKGVGATFSRVKTSFKSVWRPDELRDMEKGVSRHESLLQTKFLSNICTEGQATQIRASGGFDKLDRDLQYFINQLLAGHRSLTELVSVESTHIKEHVSDQHNETRQAITSAIRSTGSDVQANISVSASQIQDTIRLEGRERDMTAQHIQLLASLRPLEANDRLNRIDDKETKTFDWILESPPRFKSASHDDSETTDNKELSRGDARERHASKFITWLQSDSKVFWLSGKPGCGKSTLMKYLFRHPKTVAYLNHWQDGTKILSHYFWKPGTELQHNLKGMLCSLSWQLLEDPLPATDLMRQNPDMAKKISFSDWSVTELKGVLLGLLAETKCAICIALDGLDEVVQNDVAGPRGVLNFLDDVHKLKRVKVCASSRPEPEFIRYFSTHPQMHLHDLTYSDIYLVAEQRLVGDIPSHEHMRDSLSSKIARRSEGIFLWAIIVIDLLNRGFRNKDPPGQLLERLHSFPKEIELLLWDMWNRLGHDSRIYQKEASLYLRLHMALKKLDDGLEEWPYGSTVHTSPRANSLLILAIASSDTILNYNAERGGRISKEDLQEHCQKTLDRIGVCCAGLISFQSSTSTIGSDLDFATSPNLESSKFYIPSFTHRCVLDFLTDTEGGRQILGSCPLDNHQLLISGIKAFMRAGHFVPFVTPYSATRGLRSRWYYGKAESCLWQTSAMIHLAQINADEKEACNGLLRKWQLEGLFQDSKHWRHPFPIVDVRSRASLALEMSDLTFLVSVDSVIQMRSELEGKDTDDFLALIPVIARSSRYPEPYLFHLENQEGDKLKPQMRRLCIGIVCRLASIVGDHDETAGSLCQDWSGENSSLQSHPRQIAQMMLAHLFAWMFYSTWGSWFLETPIFDASHQSWNCIPSIRAMCFPLFLGIIPERENNGWEICLVGDVRFIRRGLIIVCNNAASAVFRAKSFLEATNHVQDDDPFIEVLLIHPISNSGLGDFYVVPEPADKERLSSLTYQLLLHREDNMKHNVRKEILDYVEPYLEPNGPQKLLEDHVEMLDYLNEIGYPPHPWKD